MLAQEFDSKKMLMLAPGGSLYINRAEVENETKKDNTIIVAVNFDGGIFGADYVFSSNMRRFSKIERKQGTQYIVTSNIKDA